MTVELFLKGVIIIHYTGPQQLGLDEIYLQTICCHLVVDVGNAVTRTRDRWPRNMPTLNQDIFLVVCKLHVLDGGDDIVKQPIRRHTADIR